MGIISPIVKVTDISKDHAYILHIFIKPLQQKAGVHRAEKNNRRPTRIFKSISYSGTVET